MTRVLISLLFGSLSTCAAVILADTRMGVMFVAGICCCLIAQGALICSVRRARSLARFLDAVCDGMVEHRKTSPRSRLADPEPVVDDQAESDKADVVSALRNLGMKNRRQAEAIAAAAVKEGGSLPAMIQRAVVVART